jgi:folate-binding protein YgfZ
VSLSAGSAVPPPDTAPDPGVPWHFGDPHSEQRRLAQGEGIVDCSNRGVVTVSGLDRLSWLHSLTSQHVEHLGVGESALALILSPHGHVEHELHLVDDGAITWIIAQPGTSAELTRYLESMRFMLRVDVADVSDAFAVVWEPVAEADPASPTWVVPEPFASRGYRGREVIIPRELLASRLEGAVPAGSWALEALRVEAAMPRLGQETDHRTIPHEVGWIPSAVHLQKGCYRGQETVARVQNLGKPPRRLVLLHLDGSDEVTIAHGDPVWWGDREIGWVGSFARHYELGPIALAVVKRNVPVDAELVVRHGPGGEDGFIEIAAAQEEKVPAT